MSFNLPIYIFVGGNTSPLFLVYVLEREVRIGQSSGFKIKIIAKLLHALVCNPTDNRTYHTSRRDFLKPVSPISRKQRGVKRINTGRRHQDIVCHMSVITRLIEFKPNFDLSRSSGNGSPSDSGPDDISEGSPQQIPRTLSPALILPDQTSNTDITVGGPFSLPENANSTQTTAWLRANGFQTLEATFRDFSAGDFRLLTREDLIQICGLVKGIQLYNRIKLRFPEPLRTLYFAVENNEIPVWEIIYLHHLNSKILIAEILKKFNLLYEHLHSTWVRGPHNIRISISNEVVENMKDESLYLIEIIKDMPNDSYKLLLKPFNGDNDVKKNARIS
ncbi:hypothetical protein KQX54_010059 [Cotesia glomerata]|uniref:SAM domain-containing protein n=1 Tax=Cotesia glomerata TaxID=32391 RepID=A0AAV7IL18_COTGL|nr:hypothetical protein KQX54_010059 [Cotesia glomerata]